MTSQSTKPAAWIKPFRNILELERANGFNDKAVIGGMDSFVRLYADSMLAWAEQTPAGRRLIRPGYAAMTVAEREEWASRWLTILERWSEPTPETARESSPGNPARDTGQGTSPKAASSVSLPSKAPPAAGHKKAAPKRQPSKKPPPPGITLDSPVTALKRVNDKLAAQLAKLEIATIRDLLYHFPHRHSDYSRKVKIAELWPGQELTVEGRITEVSGTPLGRQRRMAAEATLTDETGSVKVTWFGQGYLARTLKPGVNVAVSGKVEAFRGRPVFESPEYDIIQTGQPALNTGRLAPVHPLTAGLTGRNLRSLIWQALDGCLEEVAETLPDAARRRTGLLGLREAIQQAHYPDSLENCDRARRRLAFDELITLQLSVLARRRREVGLLQGVKIEVDAQFIQGIIDSLPFEPTEAQRRCLDEILQDLGRGGPPMNRLVQGDVGSGKTVVALVALLAAIKAGYQGAIMVPTEVLAEQHFRTVTRLLEGMAETAPGDNLLTVYLESLGRPMTVGLLTGSVPTRARNRLRGLAAEGTLDLLIGTQALIQEGVELPKLALAVMDEQHRFGVLQRSALRRKSGENPHTLVMSATPIPRTLTLTLHGDLDLSVIDQLPPGRPEIQTRYLGADRREAAYGFIRREIGDGRQAFIVCPLIEESEAIEARAAAAEHDRLSREVFPDLRLGLLHGRMSSGEKDRTMRRFRDGELDLLVTTAVVEVGIDVPNATVMLIEGADRFGLSQLHQFRGRVGRGEHKSYCILISDNPSESARERLAALERTRDGFQLAEIDLELRGPGDFFGTRQSGLPNLRMAQLSDRDLLDQARQEAKKIMEDDPELAEAEHQALKAQIARFTERVSVEVS